MTAQTAAIICYELGKVTAHSMEAQGFMAVENYDAAERRLEELQGSIDHTVELLAEGRRVKK